MRALLLLSIAIFSGSMCKYSSANDRTKNGIHIQLAQAGLIVKNGETVIDSFPGRKVLQSGSFKTAISEGTYDLLCSGLRTARRCAIENVYNGETLDWVVLAITNGKLSKL